MGRNMILPQPWRKLLLTVHVTSAVSVLGTDLVLLVLGISSVSGANPQTIYPAAHLIATWLLAPLALVALTTAERLPLAVAPAAGVTLLILMVVLAIFKPPWRLRSRPNIKHERG